MDVEKWKKIHRHNCNSKNKEWISFKERVFERDGHKCVCCESTEKLSCHHRNYEHFSERNDDEMNDCITLCAACHIAIHRNGKAQARFREQQEKWMESHKEEPKT